MNENEFNVEEDEIPPMGMTVRLTAVSPVDLLRTVQKSDHSIVSLPQLELEWGEGVAKFSSLSDLVKEMHFKMRHSLAYFPNGPAKDKVLRTIETLENIEAGDEEEFPFQVEISDPLAHSDFFAPDSPSPSGTLGTIERVHFERTWAQEVDLGLVSKYLCPEPALDDEAIQHIASLIQQANSVAIFSGAGVSTESGIAAYRSGSFLANQSDRYDSDHPSLASCADLLHPDATELRRRYLTFTRDFLDQVSKCQPNGAHRLATFLLHQKKLTAVVTQNIDRMYLRAGLPPENLIELHGTNATYRCYQCSQPMEASDFWLSFHHHGPDIICPQCGGLVLTNTVKYGERLNDHVLDKGRRAIQSSDLVLVMGSSLLVSPANQLPGKVLQNGGKLVQMNLEETIYDDFSSALVRIPCGQASDLLLDLLQS